MFRLGHDIQILGQLVRDRDGLVVCDQLLDFTRTESCRFKLLLGLGDPGVEVVMNAVVVVMYLVLSLQKIILLEDVASQIFGENLAGAASDEVRITGHDLKACRHDIDDHLVA